MVHLFDSLVRTIPDGVTLTSIKQEGEILTLNGRSQSNARVSTYMRNLEVGLDDQSRPEHHRSEGSKPGLPYEFNLKVKLANPNAPKDDEGGTEPAAPAAAGGTAK